MGIENLKSVELACLDMGIVLAGLAKDGIDISDLAGLLVNDKFKTAISTLVGHTGLAISEAKDLDLAEGIELAMAAAMKVPELLSAIKK